LSKIFKPKEKYMKKTAAIALIIFMFISLAVLAGCKKEEDSSPVTMDSMRAALADAGYDILEGYYEIPDNPDHPLYGVTDDFGFIYLGDFERYVPVYEFPDKAAAEKYAEYINAIPGGFGLPVLNGKYMTIADAVENKAVSQTEYRFLENLLHGRKLK